MSRSTQSKTVVKKSPLCDSLGHGTSSFMKWFFSEDKHSIKCNNIIVIDFFKDSHAIFFDKDLEKYVLVINRDGIPFCKNCITYDCGHVAFEIYLNQYYRYYGETDM